MATIAELHQQAVKRAATVVNQTLVMRNWAIGAHIVEFEQAGADRAVYGTRLLPRLSADLQRKQVPGTSTDMLERMRRLYLLYPQLASDISAPLVRKSMRTRETPLPSISAPAVRKSLKRVPTARHLILRLSWTHLAELVRIDEPAKRTFYERQCLAGAWSKRELQRQIGSLLYERTGHSSDRTGLLAEVNAQGEVESQTLADLIRDPYILEFTGLAERPRYRESHLEQALLDHLQTFLLELGTGFCLEARQKRITVGNEHDWIDLTFYHRVLPATCSSTSRCGPSPMAMPAR